MNVSSVHGIEQIRLNHIIALGGDDFTECLSAFAQLVLKVGLMLMRCHLVDRAFLPAQLLHI